MTQQRRCQAMPAIPCGKRIFESAKAAKRANANAPLRLRPYYCEACHGWHVANAEKRHTGHDPDYRRVR